MFVLYIPRQSLLTHFGGVYLFKFQVRDQTMSIRSVNLCFGAERENAGVSRQVLIGATEILLTAGITRCYFTFMLTQTLIKIS